MTSARKFAQPHLVFSSYCTAHSTVCFDVQTLTLKFSDKLLSFFFWCNADLGALFKVAKKLLLWFHGLIFLLVFFLLSKRMLCEVQCQIAFRLFC
jgi:hypothetical protein